MRMLLIPYWLLIAYANRKNMKKKPCEKLYLKLHKEEYGTLLRETFIWKKEEFPTAPH